MIDNALSPMLAEGLRIGVDDLIGGQPLVLVLGGYPADLHPRVSDPRLATAHVRRRTDVGGGNQLVRRAHSSGLPPRRTRVVAAPVRPRRRRQTRSGGRSRSQPEASHVDRDDGTRREFLWVGAQDISANVALLASRDADETDDSRVRLAPDDCQLAEILVQGHEHTLLGVSPLEDLFVARIRRPIACPDRVESERLEFDPGAAPDARIQKDLHDPVWRTGMGCTLS